MTNKWAIIHNETLKQYIAIEAKQGWSILHHDERVVRVGMTKAQALQRANIMNEMLDVTKELL
ncbi:hypothetical protein [Lactococcus phage PLG-II]|nr:hypothetical protein [Lactococcus phage PLG-II]